MVDARPRGLESRGKAGARMVAQGQAPVTAGTATTRRHGRERCSRSAGLGVASNGDSGLNVMVRHGDKDGSLRAVVVKEHEQLN
ncbi:hypothetical protein NL676_026392 [Syzygium grande]|nr:hypothetical protein NL676_026392 [Syzygium grande]